TLLDLSRLSPAAQKALGPGPGRMMASRGLVPLPPADQLAVLYSLAIDADQNLATAARTTAMGLPDKLLAGALVDPNSDPRVLDLFAQLVGDNSSAFEALVSNQTTADDTIAYLAANGGAKEIDRISGNEQRLLRHPEIIAAMYRNKLARMSTVDRVVELAVRNNIRVPGLDAWDEIAQALQAHPPNLQNAAQTDAAFAAALSNDDDTPLTVGDPNQVPDEDAGAAEPDKDTLYGKLTIPQKMRLAMVGNAVDRGACIRDPVKLVAVAAIKAGGVTEFEAARYASNPGLHEDVIKVIARKPEWTKAYGTKVALCRNPKTPITDTMRLMPFLRDKDLAGIVKSRGVPSAVVAQARKLVAQRTGPKK
ncbi:MAG TPA: hypothetical protein VGC41_29435, partial [Kofleriaceae bacterium]